jgi:putative tricarboxylic transport membrane protein
MEALNHILLGFQICLRPVNLFYCFLGVLGGTLVGVLPGLGPQAAIALLLPAALYLDPTTAIILLSGIYYGSMYGGSTTSILVNIPGEAASIVTCMDGYQMALKGRAGAALGIAAFGSFVAGTFGVMLLVLVGTPIAEFALSFGPPEYFSLMCLAFLILTNLSEGSFYKSWISILAGLFLGTIGMDMFTGQPRFTFEIPSLMDGLGLIPVIMGLFGVTEIVFNVEQVLTRTVIGQKIGTLLPNRREWKASIKPILRGIFIGSGCGILPGAGVVLSTFASYAVERRCSKHPERFGHGAIEGVAGPETANNAAAQCGFIPLFTLGIPANVTTAILLGALMLFGVKPGPMLISSNPELFWGVVASMYVGNVMLLILNLPLIGLWVQVLKVPYSILFPLILLFCLVGVYIPNTSIDEIWIMIFFGGLGYFFRKTGFELAPLTLAMVIGPIFENAFRQSLLMSVGDFSIFLTRPISAALLGSSFLLILIVLAGKFLRRKKHPPLGPTDAPERSQHS